MSNNLIDLSYLWDEVEEPLKEAFLKIKEIHPDAIILGGFWRDTYMGVQPKDMDVMISNPQDKKPIESYTSLRRSFGVKRVKVRSVISKSVNHKFYHAEFCVEGSTVEIQLSYQPRFLQLMEDIRLTNLNINMIGGTDAGVWALRDFVEGIEHRKILMNPLANLNLKVLKRNFLKMNEIACRPAFEGFSVDSAFTLAKHSRKRFP